jgi:dTDP-4-amino-4,6-dideoxygalactose transaminase
MKIPLANPSRELEYIKNFDSKIIKKINSGIYVGGNDVLEFENSLAKFLNKKYCITLNSGTDALLFSLIAAGVKKDDKVIVPSFTFFATAEVVMHLGAIPIFVDINPETYTLDIEHLKSLLSKSVKAVIPVHMFGNNAEIYSVMEICKPYGTKVIEDVAQAFGSRTSKNQKLGTIGEFGAFSFFPSKTLGGIGDGGCITTDSFSSYKMILKLRNHGIGKNYEHEMVGSNSRLDSLNAFVLKEKLKIFNKVEQSRNNFYDYYMKNLTSVDWITLPVKHNKNIIFNYFTIQVPASIRNKFLIYLNNKNIGASIYYKKPLHLQKAVLNYFNKIELKNTEKVSKRVLSLPYFAFPEEKELDYLIDTIVRFK